MSHFYVRLPCDASLGVHPSNSSSNFVTELPSEIDLNGEWEVALSEIVLPAIWNNIVANDYWFEVNRVRYALPDGHYESVYDVLKAMTAKINRTGLRRTNWPKAATVWIPDRIALGPHGYHIMMYVAGYNQVYVELLDTTTNEHNSMSFSSALATMLRFPRREYTSPTIVVSRGPSRLPRPSVACVYLDIVEPTTVGDAKKQLLRMVFLDKKPRYGEDDLHVTYTSPVYLPLKTKRFRSVEVLITTDANNPTPFSVGKSLLLLHFRRTSQ